MEQEKQEQLERFSSLYRGLDRAYGVYQLTGATEGLKVKGKAATMSAPHTPEHWVKHLAGTQGLGIVPIMDSFDCWWGAIDVDEYDGLDLAQIEENVKALGLPLTVCRTKSGGAHLYLFLTEATPAEIVRDKLVHWSAALGYPGIEVFPKQTEIHEDDVGNWINLPYFRARDTDRYAIRNGERLTLAEFLEYADEQKVTTAELVAVEVELEDPLGGAPPCLNILVKQGFPPGTRNNGLFNLGVFAKQKYGDDWKDYIDQFNRDYIDPPLPSDEVSGLIKSIGRRTYFYKCKDAPCKNYCNQDLCRDAEFGIHGENSGYAIVLERLAKVTSDPPRWIATVDGVRIVMVTDDLFNQNRFRRACFENIHKFPRKMKPFEYEAMVQNVMDNHMDDPIIVPVDASPTGLFEHHLYEFCNLPAAKSREELLMGKPWTENGKIYFRSPDLAAYLEQERFRGLSMGEMYQMLQEQFGAEHHQFNVKGRCVKCWSIDELDKQTEAFETTVTDDPLEF